MKVFEEDIPEITDVNFTDVVKYLKSLHPGTKQLFSEVFRLAKLIMVCPATNAKVHLNNIIMLHVHKDRADALSPSDVANDFIDGSEYRLSIFGNFQETDLKRAQVLVKTKSTQVSF